MKKKKPVFIRQEGHIRKRLGTKWRRPKGVHSKMREKRAGKHAQVRAGYRSLRKLRGLHKTGAVEVLVSTISQLNKINKETQLAVFASAIGQRKKQIMLKKATELGIKISNIKNPKKVLDQINAKIKKGKEEKKAKAEKKKEAEKKFKLKKKEDKKKEEPKKETPKPEEKKEEPKKAQSETKVSAVPKESKDSAAPKTEVKK